MKLSKSPKITGLCQLLGVFYNKIKCHRNVDSGMHLAGFRSNLLNWDATIVLEKQCNWKK